MKNVIFKILMFLVCLSPKALIGQCLDTDDPASNNAQNIKTSPGTTINVFDWRAINATPQYHYPMAIINSASNQTENITRLNPYHWQQGNINTDHLQTQPVESKDYDPNNGWDLVTHFLGSGTDPLNVPYVILYNRYEGILRTFFYIKTGYPFAFNAGRIEINFIDAGGASQGLQNESALLSPSKSPMKALDKFDKNILSSSPVIVNADGNFWLYADFNIGYDACTCNYLSKIKIRPFLFTITKTEETIDDITRKVTTPTSSTSGTLIPNISGFNKDIGTYAGKLTGVGKSLKAGLDAVEGLLPTKAVWETKSFIFVSDDYRLDYFDISKKTDKRTPFKFPIWVKDAAGPFGLALGIIETFTSGGGQTATVAAQGLKYKVSGIQTTELPLTPVVIFVPGSNWPTNTGNPLNKPQYNNTLGVFTLVETPRINYFSSTQEVQGKAYSYYSTNSQTASSSEYRYIKRDFQLQDDIKYAINPASGYNPTPKDLKGALVFNVDAKCLNENRNPSDGAFPPFCTFDSPLSSSLRIVRKRNANGTLSDTATITTPLMPLTCLRNYVAHLGFLGNTAIKYGNSGSRYANALFHNDVRLLIMANLVRQNDPSKEFLFEAQYQLFPTQINTAILNTPISDIQLNPVFGNLNLTSDLTIRAWETATFKGTVTTNGFKLTVIAGQEVNFENPANIPANADITIGLPTECQGSIPNPQSPSQLYAFCAKAGTKKYNPLAPLQALATSNETGSNKGVDFNIYPNPFSNQITIDYSVDSETNISLELSNALGQVVKVLVNEKVEAGSYQINASTADLPTGVYIVSMKTPTGIKTQKVVKQNQ